MSEVLRPSPPNDFQSGVIHKRVPLRAPFCAPSAQDNVGLHSQTISNPAVRQGHPQNSFAE